MWQVSYPKKVARQIARLPIKVRGLLDALMTDIKVSGPVRGNWPHYGKLAAGRHHCHLKNGRPTYVAVWEEDGETVELIRITYAGTHEKAPY